MSQLTAGKGSLMSTKAESRLLRLISGHNCLKEHMHRIKFATTPNCSCGLDVQSAEHVLISCPNHEKERLHLHLKIEHAYHIHNVPFHNSNLSETKAEVRRYQHVYLKKHTEAPPADQLIKKLKPNKKLYKESQIYPSTSQCFLQMAQHLRI